jgi:hypothetical protein
MHLNVQNNLHFWAANSTQRVCYFHRIKDTVNKEQPDGIGRYCLPWKCLNLEGRNIWDPCHRGSTPVWQLQTRTRQFSR